MSTLIFRKVIRQNQDSTYQSLSRNMNLNDGVLVRVEASIQVIYADPSTAEIVRQQLSSLGHGCDDFHSKN